MPLEISVTNMGSDKEYEDLRYGYDSFTVYVGDHRILTIYTDCYRTTTKWLDDVSKSPSNNHKHGCLLVGVSVNHNPDYFNYDRNLHNYPDPETIPYHLIQICLGSHCFLYLLPNPKKEYTPKALQTFFANPRVIAVGMKMKSVAKKLETDHGIKFANPVDLNELAVKGMKRDDLDLGRYDLDKLAKAVLGKHWDVDRHEGYLCWFDWKRITPYCYVDELTDEKAKEATIDPFFSYMIGNELLDMMDDDAWYPTEYKKFMKMNNKYKKKGKIKKKF